MAVILHLHHNALQNLVIFLYYLMNCVKVFSWLHFLICEIFNVFYVYVSEVHTWFYLSFSPRKDGVTVTYWNKLIQSQYHRGFGIFGLIVSQLMKKFLQIISQSHYFNVGSGSVAVKPKIALWSRLPAISVTLTSNKQQLYLWRKPRCYRIP